MICDLYSKCEKAEAANSCANATICERHVRGGHWSFEALNATETCKEDSTNRMFSGTEVYQLQSRPEEEPAVSCSVKIYR